MRIIHTSDLHIGRDFENSSLESVQREFLTWLIDQVSAQQADALIIAGDVWDKASPSKDAVRALTQFFDRLDALDIDTFVIAGNHDTAARLAFRGEPGDSRAVRVFAQDEDYPTPFVFTKNGETVVITGIPFLDPQRFLEPRPDAEGKPRPRTHQTVLEDAVTVARERHEGLPAAPTIAISHAYVRGGTISDSERRTIGNADLVDASVFASFDYVALGHLHRPQLIDGSEAIAYSGSPIPYSFSEAHEKSIRIVDIAPNGSITAQSVPVPMGRPVIVLTDTMDALLNDAKYHAYVEHWVSAKLTDPGVQAEPKQRLSTRFPFIATVSYASAGGGIGDEGEGGCCEEAPIAERTPEAVVADFWQSVTKRVLTEEQQTIVSDGLEQASKGGQE
ncbi:MAG: exonuclease subunit SbcD [Actinomycetes bacterium]